MSDGKSVKVVEMRSPETAPPTSPAAPPAHAPAPGPEHKPRHRRRNFRRLAIMVAVPLLLIVVGGYFWLSGGRYVSTDNAYVSQDKVTVTAEVSGRISEVAVAENQTVHRGDLLFRIDPQPFDIAKRQADAAVAAARLQVEQMRSNYSLAMASLKTAEDNLDYQQRAFDRQQDLLNRGVASRADFDAAENALRTAQQAVAQAQEQVASAKAALGGNPDIATDQHPMVMEALAKAEQAALDLANTTVDAPGDGVISQTDRLQVGQYVTPGTAVVALVENNSTWIEANFKETDLTHMSAGQAATVTLDAFPDRTLNAQVESIGAGTGAEFALIPAQNATGNWVKVVQRVPVRIRIEEPLDQMPVRAGLSASVSVDTGHRRSLPIIGTALAGD
jgi:membrane fusion protein (multidrug efflux system)